MATKKDLTMSWIADFIRIKEAGLDFAYCRGDIESAHKIEEDIEALRVMFKKNNRDLKEKSVCGCGYCNK